MEASISPTPAPVSSRPDPALPPTPEGGPAAVFEVDADGRVERWSAGAELLFGRSAAEAVGGVAPLAGESLDLVRSAAAGRAFAEAAAGGVHADGRRLELALSGSPLLDAEGRVAAVSLLAAPVGAHRLERARWEAYAAAVRQSYAGELRRVLELEESALATVLALASAIEGKDEYTVGHVQRVHDLGLLLAKAVDPSSTGEPQLSYGFLLHDVGKLAVPDAVLMKPDELTAEEWKLMRRHPEEGARILAGVPSLERALEVVLHHHERWDGGGYPGGLAGEEVPLWARIFAVVDAVDAMTSDRPYRPAMHYEAALARVLGNAGAQFDPRCAAALASLDRAEVASVLERG
jgi:hypothetical protein